MATHLRAEKSTAVQGGARLLSPHVQAQEEHGGCLASELLANGCIDEEGDRILVSDWERQIPACAASLELLRVHPVERRLTCVGYDGSATAGHRIKGCAERGRASFHIPILGVFALFCILAVGVRALIDFRYIEFD